MKEAKKIKRAYYLIALTICLMIGAVLIHPKQGLTYPVLIGGDIFIHLETELGANLSGAAATLVCTGGVTTSIGETDESGNIYISVADLGDSAGVGIYSAADCDTIRLASSLKVLARA
jgi:hypothetical protein